MENKNRNTAAIGVFDSGVGGLTVTREIMRQLPNENVVYFGDTARVPYGSKSKNNIIRFSRQIIRFLKTKNVKAIVIACNTASALALETVQQEFDMPHVLSFLNHDYKEIFEVLNTDTEVAPLLGPFQTAFENKAMEQLEGMIGTLRVQISRLATKESYWVFSGDDFDLKVSDPKSPSYLLIANDPEMESIVGALNALILNRLVTRVNSGQGKNVPVSIIVDELPTLYFHKIDRLIGTARSNKVAVTLGFQELPQLEADYSKVGKDKIITTVGNVISGSARSKDTLDWLSGDIFGKVVQLKKGITIDRDRTSINLNENMDSLVPASKISDMASGWICGQTARDFTVTKTGRKGAMDIQKAEEFKTSKFFCKTNFDMDEIKKEEADYANYPLPKFYVFESPDAKERMLSQNFSRINQEVDDMIKHIQTECKN